LCGAGLNMIALTMEGIDHHSLTDQVRRLYPETKLGIGPPTDIGFFYDFQRETPFTPDDLEKIEKKMAEIERDTRERWPVGEMAMVHRLGHLPIGEVSVAVAVSCPHRAQAFEACRYAIERLKEIVPIWKKESWADGSTEWVHPDKQ